MSNDPAKLMCEVPPLKVLVVGLGNPILSDDGVGILTARAVAERLPPDPCVDVVELSVGGLSLMEEMVGYQHVVLIDAIKTTDGVPGQVYHLGLDSLLETMNTSSVHHTNLATALQLGRSLGANLPGDAFIDVIAIEVEDVLTFKDEPTPLVSAAIPAAADLVMNVLAEANMLVEEGRYDISRDSATLLFAGLGDCMSSKSLGRIEGRTKRDFPPQFTPNGNSSEG